MSSYSQDGRLLAINTPLGKDELLLQELAGQEGISRLFSYELDLLGPSSESIDLKDIVGQKVSIAIRLPDGKFRNISGYISRFSQGGSDERYFTRYHAQVVPWLWFLTRHSDCRIFQNETPPDIISDVLKLCPGNDFRLSLQGTYPELEYCVQYRETSFNFVSRLMEEYGIFYYFDHTKDGKHTMILADQSSGLPPCLGSPASYDTEVGGLEDPEVVSDWNLAGEVQTAKYSLRDYNFTTPSTDLLASNNTVVKLGANQGLELFDYPGLYLDKDQGDNVAKLRMQTEETSYLVITGGGNYRGFTPGYSFDLRNHYRTDQNSNYLLTEVRHRASAGDCYLSKNFGGESYSNQFTCIPSSVPYRPLRITPKPFVQGPQTALVVGKEGEEIWVDKYGRVIVQFYWDRKGEKNEKSSCWIRISQPWAGGKWGSMWIPRIGQEVIVSFEEGDPDRPLITGRVYNAEEIVPYELPTHQTVSTFKSRSSKGGGEQNYNEIRFEDNASKEQIFIRAEKDMDERVKNDSREYVMHDRHLIVENEQHELVKVDKHGQVKGKHFEKIDSDMSLQIGGKQMEKTTGDQSIEVGGDQKEKVGGTVSLQIAGDQKEQVGGSLSLQVGQSRNTKIGMTDALEAGQTIHLKGGMNVVIEAGLSLTLQGPGGFVNIGPTGVAIQGTLVLINSGGAAGSAPDASPQSPDTPDAPVDPKDPDTADDGEKWGKAN